MFEGLFSSHLEVFYTVLLGVIGVISVYFYARITNGKQTPKSNVDQKAKSTLKSTAKCTKTEGEKEILPNERNKIKILYGTQTGKSKHFAENL